ncbi:MAG TPA: hypothetical protein VFE08_08810, partial [Candidatus Sulfotelmatobacter sp.]|nr:hypothetical protein [Candidatus Sulfotelmatobacter sp.]
APTKTQQSTQSDQKGTTPLVRSIIVALEARNLTAPANDTSRGIDQTIVCNAHTSIKQSS